MSFSNFNLKLITHIFKKIVAISLTPIIVIMRLLKPIVHFRIGYFSSDRIGHFAYDLGLALAEKSLSANGNYCDLRYLQGPTCNTQLEIMAKRSFYIFPWVKYLFHANMIVRLLDELIPYRRINGSRDTNGLLELTNKRMEFSEKEKKAAILDMNEFGWSKGEKFVCLNVRDGAFFSEASSSKHSYRNTNIDDYNFAITELAKQGFWVFRTGKKMEQPLTIKHDRIVDYAFSSKRSDLLDIWLFSNCHFCISAGTGIDAVADIYRRPIVYVNYLPIGLMVTWSHSITSPKKMVWSKTGVMLKLSECLENNYTSSVQYKNAGIKFINLTPEEIFMSIKEMNRELSVGFHNNKINTMQIDFWKTYRNWNGFSKYHGFIHSGAHISNYYLNNNHKYL